MRRLLLPVGVLLALALPAPAGAATTLGSTGTAGGDGCSPKYVFWGTDPGFTVPAGGGVITSMATTSSVAAGTMSFKVIRGATVIGSSASFPVAVGVNRLAMRVPVTGGEFIGMYENSAPCVVDTGSGSTDFASVAGDPPVGTAIAGAAPNPGTLAVEARLEPDADRDEYGDETQDSCPLDPEVHSGGCASDLAIGQSVTPTTIGVGDVAVATVTVSNPPGSRVASGMALGVTSTPGLQIIGTVPSAGCVLSLALSCPLGSLGDGATTVAAVVLQGVATGAQKVSTGISAASPDPNAANNTATTAVTVEAREPVACRVPSLKGLTKAVARRLLKATNCRLGKASRKKARSGRRGTVVKQAMKAGTTLRAGAKVNVTIRK